MQISTCLWKTVHLSSENASCPGAIHTQAEQAHKHMLFSLWLLHSRVLPGEGEMQTHILTSLRLRLEAASTVIETR